jgi:O-antigen/teichoic acid export membrane protein
MFLKLPSFFSELKKRSFLFDVSRLSFGTIGGRLMVFASMPIATRLYSPEDFKILAIYMAVVGILAVIACLRFDIAIPIAKSDQDAIRLLILSLFSAFSISLLVAGLLWMLPNGLINYLKLPKIQPYFWLVPVGILMSASYSAFQYWATRRRHFGIVARTRIFQAFIGVSSLLCLGFIGIAPFGLLLGNMLNMGAGCISLCKNFLSNEKYNLNVINIPGLLKTFIVYKRYFFFSVPEALVNIAGVQVSVLLISTYAGNEAAYLFLAMQVIMIPTVLIGSSISQVYLSRAGLEMAEGRLAEFTLSTMKHLAKVGIFPLVVIGFAAPTIFPIIFGQKWEYAGEVTSWLVPWAILQFISSPVSMVMHVTGRQKSMLLLTTFGGFVRIALVFFAQKVGDATFVIEIFAVASAVFYGICCLSFATASGFKFKYRALKIPLLISFVLVAYTAITIIL